MATPRSAREGRGLVTFAAAALAAACCTGIYLRNYSHCASAKAVCFTALYSAGPITAHYSVTVLFNRKLQGINQLGNHKQLLCQSSRTNYAALALAQCE